MDNKEKKSKKQSVLKKIAKPKEEKAVPVKDPFDTIKFVLMSEKAIQLIESQNKLAFIVDRKSDKSDVKAAVENAFESPVSGVQTCIDQKGRKKAFVKFKKEAAAGEIAIRLGII